ncbi:hypothetical protein [Saccharibacillus sacchari]|uniref:Uncharacterized protein n=1 Tax=Saccharibacillus sacchari TaxID=456493 RepID=A0ACC6PHW4_9BACL
MDKQPSNPGTERLVKLMTAADFVFFLIGAAAIGGGGDAVERALRGEGSSIAC